MKIIQDVNSRSGTSSKGICQMTNIFLRCGTPFALGNVRKGLGGIFDHLIPHVLSAVLNEKKKSKIISCSMNLSYLKKKHNNLCL